MNFSNAYFTNLIAHKVGNPVRDGDLKLSDKEIYLDEPLEKALIEYFLKPFSKVFEVHSFHHEIDLKMNEVFHLADNILENDSFVLQSINIAKHLFNQTRNPSIKDGELFVCKIQDIQVDNEMLSGVGIFKSERKDSFFKIEETDNRISVYLDLGIGKQKLDKGCIILEDNYKSGFQVYSYEHNNADTDYWRKDFLKIQPISTEYSTTRNFFSDYKTYITQELPKEIGVTKVDQIDLINKSVEYLSSTDELILEEFETSVLGDDSLRESFQMFKEQSLASNKEIPNRFTISKPALVKEKRSFKNVLNLDSNFQIIIKANAQLIERGTDPSTGKQFYKLYFDEEH